MEIRNQRVAVLTVVGVIVFFLIFVFSSSTENTVEVDSTTNVIGLKNEEAFFTENAPIPYYSKIHVKEGVGIEYFWPTFRNPRGILFLFHRCSRDGNNWFELPEEVNFVRNAIELGLLPIAFSSSDRTLSKCWDTTQPNQIPDLTLKNHDLAPVADAIQYLIFSNNWSELPLVVLGVSDGAIVASMLPKQLNQLKFLSMMLYIPPNEIKVSHIVNNFNFHY